MVSRKKARKCWRAVEWEQMERVGFEADEVSLQGLRVVSSHSVEAEAHGPGREGGWSLLMERWYISDGGLVSWPPSV